MDRIKILATIVVIVALSSLLAGCTQQQSPLSNSTGNHSGNQTGNMSGGNMSGNKTGGNQSGGNKTGGNQSGGNTSGGSSGGTATISISAQNIQFNQSKITIPAGAKVTVNFDNKDNGVPHNFAVYQSAGGQELFKGEVITGPKKTTYTFTAPSRPGTYHFQCDIHPTQMNGQLIVTGSGSSSSGSKSSSSGNQSKTNTSSNTTSNATTNKTSTNQTSNQTTPNATTPKNYNFNVPVENDFIRLTNSTDNWPMVNYDNTMSRNSPQTIISKKNVNQLQEKWIFDTGFPVEDPPLIVGNTAYIQNNAEIVYALNLSTGLPIWQYNPGIAYTSNTLLPRATSSHGITYNNSVIYAPTGSQGTIVALDARTGGKIWESPKLQNGSAWRQTSPPLIYKDLVIGGSALGDNPPFGQAAQGSITAISKKDGSIVWQTKTAVGTWVEGKNATLNGGATTWTGGAIDTQKGIAYLPCGNPAPDFNSSSRPANQSTNYSNAFIAVDLTNGQILWNQPFISKGSILPNVYYPDTHDWDTAWGSNLVTATINGTTQKVVIGHDKRGDIMAMNASTGKPLWWNNLAFTRNVDKQATKNGSAVVWPGPGYGVEDFTATDNNTLYVASSSMGAIYYSNGTVAPAFNSIWNGLGNGSIAAIDLATGNIKWKIDTPYPTFVSPLVTNGMVFSGHLTASGKYYNYSVFDSPTSTPITICGLLIAFDTETGQMLWQTNLGAQVGIGGPSIGNGYLLVPTGGGTQTPASGGYVVAYGLPQNTSTNYSNTSEQIGRTLPVYPMSLPFQLINSSTPPFTPSGTVSKNTTGTQATTTQITVTRSVNRTITSTPTSSSTNQTPTQNQTANTTGTKSQK